MKILCPYHKERTPSCKVYPDGHAWCFACCKFFWVDGSSPEAVAPPPEKPEDLDEAFAYISGLPTMECRGLLFPADERGYYVCWPDKSYYKKRMFDSSGPKYIGAKGHKKPPFWVRKEGEYLVVVEGEINALSIAKACPDYAVMSPGGSGDFKTQATILVLRNIANIDIIIIADCDASGAKAVISLYGALAGKGRKVETLLMPTDANEILVTSGQEALRETIQGRVEDLLGGGTSRRPVPTGGM